MKLGKTARKNDINWVYNNGRYERETICAEKWMRLIYESPAKGAPILFLVKRKTVSKLYGLYCKTSMSAKKVDRFISRYNVDMTGCADNYKNYAEFFSREKEGIIFPSEPGALGSPCDGLASAYENIETKNLIAAKGEYFTLAELFGDERLAAKYEGGVMIRIRLTPTDYHRIHFFDDGRVSDSKKLKGDLFSVNPLAIKRVARLYCRNKRALIKFKSKNFGEAAMVEVGATFVGSIVHCFKNGDSVRRGRQAGFFLPGGSLLLMFFTKGRVKPDEGLLEQTARGFETKISVGDILGRRA